MFSIVFKIHFRNIKNWKKQFVSKWVCCSEANIIYSKPLIYDINSLFCGWFYYFFKNRWSTQKTIWKKKLQWKFSRKFFKKFQDSVLRKSQKFTFSFNFQNGFFGCSCFFKILEVEKHVWEWFGKGDWLYHKIIGYLYQETGFEKMINYITKLLVINQENGLEKVIEYITKLLVIYQENGLEKVIEYISDKT